MEHTNLAPTHRHIICWKSSLAGLAIALVVFSGLIALAVAFGGIALSDGTTWQRLSVLTALSLVFSVFLAAFGGAYYSVRVARMKVDLAAMAQGLLVGSLFLLLVLCQGVSAVGTMVKATGAVIGGAAAGSGAAITDPAVQDLVEDSASELRLKAEPSVVAKGLASRLLRGDTEGAKRYLAYQASLTPEQADQKMNELKAKVDAALVKTREATATALKAAGWTVFLLMVVGLFAAAIGGLLGAKTNERYFLDMSHEEVLRVRQVR